MSIEKICCPSCHHYGNNQHERDQVSYRCGKCGTTWPRINTLDDTQCCPVCEETGKQLETAKQRELELLAVIEKIRTVFNANENFLSELATIKDILEAEPSQALREHEAKVLDAVAKHCGAYGDKLIREHNAFSESKIAHELRVYYERMAEERRKK